MNHPNSPVIPARPGWKRRLGYLKHALTVKAMVPASLLLRVPSDAATGVGVITYHRVTPRVRGKVQPTLNVTPDRFRQQLAGLLERGYVPQHLSTVVEDVRAGRPLQAKRFVVAFDDGYENLYHYAWPILRELKVPATIFLATGYVDSDRPLPFDEWSWAGSSAVPAAAWRMLSTDQCREMLRDEVIEFGSHTHLHEDFRQRKEAFRQDLESSLTYLREQLEVRHPTFALPYGLLDAGMLEVLRDSALQCCLTSDSQLIRSASDPFLWGRFGSEQYDTPATLAAKLSGVYSHVQNLWRRVRPAALSRRAHEQAYAQSQTP